MTFTVSTLAAHWHCSEGVIRKLIAHGELGCFRLGTLIRIPAEEVARFECQTIPSSDSAGDMPSSGETEAGDDATNWAPQTARELTLRRAGFGLRGTVHRGPWAE